MKNKVITFFLLLVLTTGLLSGCATDNSEDSTVKKEITYQTEDKSEKKDSSFQEKIHENGKSYKLDHIEYKVISKENKKKNGNYTKEVVSDPIIAGENYAPVQEFVDPDNGVKFSLSNAKAKEKVVDDVYSQEVTGYTDYDQFVDSSSVPSEKTITTTNENTGEVQEVVCTLTGIEPIENLENSYIDITYISYDSDYFQWGDMVVKKNESKPDLDSATLVKSVGADPNTCTVKNVYWRGKTYTQNGEICRDARADVTIKKTYYRANYTGTLQTSGTVYTAEYTGILEYSVPDQYIYDMSATAIYHQSHIALMVGAGIGILILIAAIVWLLMFFSKKKKENNSEEKSK